VVSAGDVETLAVSGGVEAGFGPDSIPAALRLDLDALLSLQEGHPDRYHGLPTVARDAQVVEVDEVFLAVLPQDAPRTSDQVVVQDRSSQEAIGCRDLCLPPLGVGGRLELIAEGYGDGIDHPAQASNHFPHAVPGAAVVASRETERSVPDEQRVVILETDTSSEHHLNREIEAAAAGHYSELYVRVVRPGVQEDDVAVVEALPGCRMLDPSTRNGAFPLDRHHEAVRSVVSLPYVHDKGVSLVVLLGQTHLQLDAVRLALGVYLAPGHHFA